MRYKFFGKNSKGVSHLAGNFWWVRDMVWSGKNEFGASPTTPFLVDGEEAGMLQSHGPLAFLKVCLRVYVLHL